MPTPLTGFQQLVDGLRPPPPIADLIGFTLSAISPGEAAIEPGGSQAPGGRTARQRLGFVECDTTDEQQSLVARASSTCMTLRGEQAQGR